MYLKVNVRLTLNSPFYALFSFIAIRVSITALSKLLYNQLFAYQAVLFDKKFLKNRNLLFPFLLQYLIFSTHSKHVAKALHFLGDNKFFENESEI